MGHKLILLKAVIFSYLFMVKTLRRKKIRIIVIKATRNKKAEKTRVIPLGGGGHPGTQEVNWAVAGPSKRKFLQKAREADSTDTNAGRQLSSQTGHRSRTTLKVGPHTAVKLRSKERSLSPDFTRQMSRGERKDGRRTH